MKAIYLLTWVFLTPFIANASESLVVASGDWAPFQGKDIDKNGFASEVVRHAFHHSKVKVTFKYFPWSRSLEMTKSGKTDATFLWGYNKEREKDFLYSEKIVDVSYVFFSLKNTQFDWKGIEDLKNYKIGVTAKYSYGEDFDKAVKSKKLKVATVPKDLLNFRKLLAGRIQVFPNELNAGYDLIKKNFSPKEVERFTHHQKPLRNAPHYMLFSKKSKKARSLLKAFNEGLAKLKASGEYQKLVADYTAGI